MIKQQLVADNTARKVTYGGGNPKKYIVIHETANTKKGANAQAHANLQSNGNSRQASWHYQVDDEQVIQSFSDNTKCWHAGNKRYNEQSIGIEICVNSDGDFKKAVDNAIELTKLLMSKHNIPVANVIQHNKASGKDCPRYLRSGDKGITWSQFVDALGGKVVKPTNTTSKPKKAVKPKETTNKASRLIIDGKWGKDTTRSLQRALGTPIDGILSRQKRNVVTEALYGNTVSYGHDGGSIVVRALQQHLKDKMINLSVDGLLGPATIRALQTYLGTVVDGRLSRPSLVVKELQRRLNAGTF